MEPETLREIAAAHAAGDTVRPLVAGNAGVYGNEGPVALVAAPRFRVELAEDEPADAVAE